MGRHHAPKPLKAIPYRRSKLLHYTVGAVAASLVLSSVVIAEMTIAPVDLTSLSASLAPDKRDDVDCPDLKYQENAQLLLDADRSDPNRLDDDKDGKACEDLPTKAVYDEQFLNDVPPFTGTLTQAPFVPGSPEAAQKDVSAPETSSAAPTTTKAPLNKLTLPRASSAPVPQPADAERADPAPVKPVTSVSPKCLNIKSGVKANVYAACNRLLTNFPQVKSIGGFGLRPGNPTSCHPKGQALDVMVYNDMGLGDKIYAYVRANKASLGATTILWKVANHYDHVHISFEPCKF